MSSAPAGVDVREYAYGYFSFQGFADGTPHTFSANNRWLVTRIQFFAGPDDDMDVVLEAGGGGSGGPPDFIIRKGGCLTLEPNGAFRGRIDVTGQGGFVMIEFWWQPTGDVTYPAIVVTP
jgi:hypothetical protein